MKVEPYLFFNGQCEEAIAFYQEALGAKLMALMRMNESPEPPAIPLPANWGTKVMHAMLQIGETNLLLSDGSHSGEIHFKGFFLSLSTPDASAAKRAFDALAEKGEVRMPLGKTFWSPCFGMVVDRFGVGWMLIVYA
jgi:PhnB protein